MTKAKGRPQDVPEPSSSERASPAAEPADTDQPAAANHESPVKLFTFTVDAKSAQIVKFESFDASGAPCELSEEEKTSLKSKGNGDELEDLIEQAFEAGIACVLGDGAAGETKESREDAELRHLLLTPLIERSMARRLLTGEALNRTLLDTLIQHSMKMNADSAVRGSAAGNVQ